MNREDMPLVRIHLLDAHADLAEDMGEWQNVNAYASGTFTLNRWVPEGFRARLVRFEPGQSLVIAQTAYFGLAPDATEA